MYQFIEYKNGLSDYTDDFLQFVLDTNCSIFSVIKTLKLAVVGSSYELIETEIKKRNLDTAQFEKNKKAHSGLIRTNKLPEEVFVKNSGITRIGKYIKRFNVKDTTKCERCGISEWMGEPITIEIHHLDGDHFNNELDNLVCLCPNCHSQMNNTGGKSSRKNYKKNNFSMEKDCACVDCGIKIYSTSIRCKDCYYKFLLENKKISKKVLVKLVGEGKDSKEISTILFGDVNEEYVIVRDCKSYGLLNKLSQNSFLTPEQKQKKFEDWKMLNQPRFLSQYTDEEFRVILKEEIRKYPMVALEKKYGVSTGAIRKWCKRLGLPNRKSEINSYSDEEWEKI